MSQLVAWKDSFAIDDGLIDADHKYLISLINDVLVAMRDGRDQDEIRRMIGRLRCFARLHFDREEILQSVAGFEERGFHARRHNELMIQLDEAFEILAEEEPADRRG
ncbi:MAG TPA: hemerythrin domain-containing protein, partial [Kaistiaceae bacterium]|nr:hemerythrin domain-containing protein [Kaistiaceae bacterium]